MPYSREFSMQFYHQRFPSSALINRSVFNLENLYRINGSGPLGTSATVWVCKSNENHANGMVFQIYREFSMQFYHQRFPSSTLLNRSVYNLENLDRINGCGPLATSATVWVYKSNENHANGRVMPICREFSMQFYHQRFPSSALTVRSIYTLKNLF